MRVGEAKQRDIGKKRARIGPDAMDYLQVTPGDVIQINAKKRAIIEVENGVSEENLLVKITRMNELQKFFTNKKIIKSIFIKDKLINLIVK